VLLGAAAVLLALAAVIALGVVLTGGSSNGDVPAQGSLTDALPGAADVEELLDGIPQSGNALGSPSAPVTLVEYADLQCPFCRDFDVEAFPELVERYIRPGTLRFETLLLAFIGPDSQRGRDGAIAAGEQDRLFNFTHLLYLNQGAENSGWLNEDMVASAAASIPGVDVSRVLENAESSATEEQASAFDAQAEEAGVSSTPTFFVGKTGATPQPVELGSAGDIESLAAAIEAARG
jgi:protein-disulfide isomerase